MIFWILAQTICLNMIVKDESAVIERCLESVKPLIDSWVIVDTGSKDGTQQIIERVLAGIPGTLYERSWVDFAYNRNEALQLAGQRGDYLLFMDADEWLVAAPEFDKSQLDKELYFISYQNEAGSYSYSRAALVQSRLRWQWAGEIHETLESLEPRQKSYEYLKSLINITANDGQRSQDPQKGLKDAAVLLRMLEKNPLNERAVFYLAQSYAEAKEIPSAIEWYEKRGAMKGWDEETFWALYQAACLRYASRTDLPEVLIQKFQKAYDFRPSRVEPLYYLAQLYRTIGHPFAGYAICKHGLQLPPSQEFSYREKWIADYGLLQELSNCAYALNYYAEAAELCQKILSIPGLPSELKAILLKNLGHVQSKLSDAAKTENI